MSNLEIYEGHLHPSARCIVLIFVGFLVLFSLSLSKGIIDPVLSSLRVETVKSEGGYSGSLFLMLQTLCKV